MIIGYDKEVGGIGDFVYILFQYYYFYVERGCDAAEQLKIYIPDHPLKKCIECVAAPTPQHKIVRAIACSTMCDTFIDYIYSESMLDDAIIFSNMNDFLHLCVRHEAPSKLAVLRREFRERVFRISPCVEEHVDNLIAISPAFYGGGKYTAIHLRCGDKYLRGCENADDRCSQDLFERFERGVNFLRRLRREEPIFIFCDNPIVKNDLATRFDCFTFNTNIVHVADADTRDIDIIDTFSEFVLLIHATEIFAVTISNFSQVPAFIYDIPIYTIDAECGKIVKCISI